MSLEATLDNIIGELLQRNNEAARAEHDVKLAQDKATTLRQEADDCKRVIGETFKPKTGERRIVYGRNLITINVNGWVNVETIEHIK